MLTIGIAGIGRMGSAIADRLLATGQRVAVWNRTAARAEALRAAGASVASSAAELASASDIVISMLTDASAINETYCGEHGLLLADVRDKLFVEMSTVRPRVHVELAVAVTRAGARLLESPVGGSVGAAREGRLFAFVGGEVPDVERAMPVLNLLCRRVEHIGGIGAGASVKLAVNLPMHIYWHALNEALALCAPLQVESARLLDIFADTSGAPNSLKARQAHIVSVLAGNDSSMIDFDIDAIRKDLVAITEEARSLGTTTPLTDCALALYDEAVSNGFGRKGAASLLRR
jgi:3-hydroxyisobutyrate dehydrogenase